MAISVSSYMYNCRINENISVVFICITLNATTFVLICSSWVFRFIQLGNQKELESKDVYNIPETDSTEVLGELLDASWQKELQNSSKKAPSLFRALCRVYLIEYFHQVIIGIIFRCILK